VSSRKVFTTIPDFDTGTYVNTQHVAYGDGAVELANVVTALISFDMGASTRGQSVPSIQSFLDLNVESGATSRGRDRNRYAHEGGPTTKGEGYERIGNESGSTTRGGR